MPVSIESIIERLGGAEAAARLVGVGTEAVRKWRQAKAIPPRHWAAVTAATGLTMADAMPVSTDAVPDGATAALVLSDGSVFWGTGFGAHTANAHPVGEVCFNTGL